MPAVNTAEWLMAIDAHLETLDTYLVVATALANGDAEVGGIEADGLSSPTPRPSGRTVCFR
jgi:hypothetical protein